MKHDPWISRVHFGSLSSVDHRIRGATRSRAMVPSSEPLESAAAGPAGPALDGMAGPVSRWQRLRDWIWGYDFFISYQWSSGGRYAAALANRLREPPEPCDVMLDAAEFAAGGDWRTQAGAALRNTQRLILVGTPGALEESAPVAAEVAAFTSRSRLIVPVVFDEQILRRPRAGHRVLGLIPEDAIFVVEDPSCLATGPSADAVAAIKRTHRLLRRRSLRTRLLLTAALIVAGAAGFGGWAGLVRWQAAQRSTAATAALLARAEAALAADDVQVAETVLAEAERRLRDAATDELQTRTAARRADVERLRELLAIEDASWAVVDGNLPVAADIDHRYQEFFTRHAGSLATTNPRDVAGWISETAIAERLGGVLDLLVARQAEQALAAENVLAELDDDPYRRRLRRAFAAGNVAAVAPLLDAPELAEQSPRLLLAVASSPITPTAARQSVLLGAWRRHPDDYGILMRLGTVHSSGWGGTGITDAERMARISYFRAALAVRPGSVAAWNDLAAALVDVGLWAEGRGAAEQAIALDPTDPLPHVNASQACLELDDADAAERHAREAVALGPKVANAHNALGIVLMNGRRDPVAAAAALRTAVALDPRVPQPHYNLGQALSAAGLQQEALAAYRAAAEAAPESPDYWLVLAFETFESGDESAAFPAFCRGIALAKSGDHAASGRAEDLWRDTVERIETARLAVVIASAAIAQHAPREALAAVARGLELEPDDALLHYSRGEALLALGEFAAAAAACRTSLELAPAFAPAWNNLGLACLAQDDVEEAVAALTEAVRLEPGYAKALVNLGNCRLRQGAGAEAIAAYEEATRQAPDYATAWANLSAARRQAGDLDGAAAAAARADALLGGSPQAPAPTPDQPDDRPPDASAQ